MPKMLGIWNTSMRLARVHGASRLAPASALRAFSSSSEVPYDYLVIGAGSGGMASSRRAASYPNTRVAVIEQARLGGTCVNVGCVPKKIMYLAANMNHVLHRDAFHYGFESADGARIGESVTFHWDKLKARRDAYILRLNGIYERCELAMSRSAAVSCD